MASVLMIVVDDGGAEALRKRKEAFDKDAADDQVGDYQSQALVQSLKYSFSFI